MYDAIMSDKQVTPVKYNHCHCAITRRCCWLFELQFKLSLLMCLMRACPFQLHLSYLIFQFVWLLLLLLLLPLILIPPEKILYPWSIYSIFYQCSSIDSKYFRTTKLKVYFSSTRLISNQYRYLTPVTVESDVKIINFTTAYKAYFLY